MSFHTLRLVLGDQLNAGHSWYRDKDPGILYLVAELRQETDYIRHHVQKICAFFAAMRDFADALASSGKSVRYLSLDDTAEYHDLADLIGSIIQQEQIQKFQYQRPDEYRLLKQCREMSWPDVEVSEFDTEHFLLPFDEIEKEIKPGKSAKMEFFYRRMRKRYDILMAGDQPAGGQWNYDQQNRNPITDKDYDLIPRPLMFRNSVAEILARLDRHKVDYFGEVHDPLPWPVNRKQARRLLKHFCTHCLPDFGRYQDAMTTGSKYHWSLFHSRLSFALNTKMLSPLTVIDAAIDYYHQHQSEIDIAQIEGFVRQILGWREYIRGIYWANMPKYSKLNALKARRRLPSFFWSGETRMSCMRHAIGQSLEYAYAHHIQRLMITGNFCLLAGIDPRQVDGWYLGIYIDAIEWVEMPNTRGMTQYADDGLVASKPYAASGAYVNRMSNYCRQCEYNVKKKVGEDACPLNSMYWHFITRHADRFRSNGRMQMVYRNLDKMETSMLTQVMERAEWCLDHLDEL